MVSTFTHIIKSSPTHCSHCPWFCSCPESFGHSSLWLWGQLSNTCAHLPTSKTNATTWVKRGKLLSFWKWAVILCFSVKGPHHMIHSVPTLWWCYMSFPGWPFRIQAQSDINHYNFSDQAYKGDQCFPTFLTNKL